MRFRAARTDPGTKGQWWDLEFTEESLTLFDPAGQVALQLAPADVVTNVTVPKFGGDTNSTRFVVGAAVVSLALSGQSLSLVKKIRDRGLVAMGPDTIRVVLRVAVRDFVLGTLLFIGGIIISLVGYWAAAKSPNGGSFYVLWGVSVLGFAWACRGIYGFFHYFRLKALAPKSSSVPPPLPIISR